MNIDNSLLQPLETLPWLHFTFTDKCNLKCRYCPKSCQDTADKAEMDASLLDTIVHYCISRGIKNVGIGHYGETMTYAGWWKTVDLLLDHGIEIDLCSNFSHDLSKDEIRVLSRLKRIQMSIDSFDYETLKFLRPPADIRKIIYNLHRIRSTALVAGTDLPEFAWNCVITNRSLQTIDELIASAASCGVHSIVLNHCVRYEGCTDAVKSIFELTDQEYIAAYEKIQKAKSLAQKLSVDLLFGHQHIDKTLKDLYDSKTNPDSHLKESDILTTSQPYIGLPGRVNYLFDKRFMALGQGMTRRCTSPWDRVYISVTGDVYPCCVDGVKLGTVTDETSLDNILRGPAYQAYRRDLLLGQLDGKTCAECPVAFPVPVDAYQRDMENYLKPRRSMM